MLSKDERVGARGMAARTLRSGRFSYGTYKILALPSARAAVVVSKKVFANAPARNRLRRRVAAILREMIRSGALAESVVVYPSRAAAEAPHALLRASLREALRVR